MKDWKLLKRVANGHMPDAVEQAQINRISDELFRAHMMHEGKICCEVCGQWRSDQRAVSLPDDAGWLCGKCAAGLEGRT